MVSVLLLTRVGWCLSAGKSLIWLNIFRINTITKKFSKSTEQSRPPQDKPTFTAQLVWLYEIQRPIVIPYLSYYGSLAVHSDLKVCEIAYNHGIHGNHVFNNNNLAYRKTKNPYLVIAYFVLAIILGLKRCWCWSNIAWWMQS
jgi:hypothetical protein